MVVTVRDGYNFLYSENISSLSRNLRTKQPKRRHLGCTLQRSHSACDWSNERQWVHLLKYGHHLWFYFEQTMWTKGLSYYGWNEPKTFVIFFSNEWVGNKKCNLLLDTFLLLFFLYFCIFYFCMCGYVFVFISERTVNIKC